MEFLRPQLMALSMVVVMMPSGTAGGVLVVDAREQLARKTGLKLGLTIHDPIITWPGHPPRFHATPRPIRSRSNNAARAWGIETDYWDIWGKQHHASPELETAILGSLGVDTRSSASLQDAIERREQQRQWRLASRADHLSHRRDMPARDPCFAAGRITPIHTRLLRNPTGRREARVELEIALANEMHGHANAFVFPMIFRWAITSSSLQIAGESWRPSRLIVCPGRAFEPAWLAGGPRRRTRHQPLRLAQSQRNWGCGDTTDL